MIVCFGLVAMTTAAAAPETSAMTVTSMKDGLKEEEEGEKEGGGRAA